MVRAAGWKKGTGLAWNELDGPVSGISISSHYPVCVHTYMAAEGEEREKERAKRSQERGREQSAKWRLGLVALQIPRIIRGVYSIVHTLLSV